MKQSYRQVSTNLIPPNPPLQKGGRGNFRTKIEISKYVDYHKRKNELIRQKIEKKRLYVLKEARRLGKVIGREFNPTRIYLFGSVLDPDLFETYSDLDIAVEDLNIEDFYKAHAIAEEVSPIKLDFLNFNRLEGFVKERIIRTGKIIYENK